MREPAVTGARGRIQVRPGEAGRIIVLIPYSPERVAKIKTVPGRRWHPTEKYWSFPDTPETIEKILRAFEGEEMT